MPKIWKSTESVLIHVVATFTIIFAIAIALSGCSHVVWEKPGATQADFEADRARCQYEAKLGTPNAPVYSMGQAIGTGIAEGLRENQLGSLCMHARGYSSRVVQDQ